MANLFKKAFIIKHSIFNTASIQVPINSTQLEKSLRIHMNKYRGYGISLIPNRAGMEMNKYFSIHLVESPSPYKIYSRVGIDQKGGENHMSFFFQIVSVWTLEDLQYTFFFSS